MRETSSARRFARSRRRGLRRGADERAFAPSRRFEVVRRIGAGGMGIVYQVRDAALGTRAAA